MEEERNQPKPPTQAERIEELENENAFLARELADAYARLEQTEQDHAELLLYLVTEEVI